MSTFVIAEVGVNHNGDLAMALALVDCAARSGCDAVKFQTFSADKVVWRGVEKARYQALATSCGDQYDMLKALELSSEAHVALARHCASVGIEFMSTPFDEAAADFLLTLGLRRFKVPSGEITNEPLIRHIAATGRPVIMSTGMATLAEVRRASQVVEDARRDAGCDGPLADGLTLLHCTSSYPASVDDVNLRAMRTLHEATGLPVGYSDHTLGTAVATAAVALGAVVIEKHVTMDRRLPGPDHAASLTPDELTMMVRHIRDIERALGSAEKRPTPAELEVRALVRRSVTAVQTIRKGASVGSEDVAILRPGTGIPPAELGKVVGRTAARELPAGTTLVWDDLV